MDGSQGWLGQFVLRWASPIAGLRRMPILGKCVSWAAAKAIPRHSRVWVQVRRGPGERLWLHLNPRTGGAYFEGTVEREVQGALEKHLRPGMTVYDIGANMGFFSLVAARLVGKDGRVVAFEADPEVAMRLRENVKRNAMSWIAVEEKAMWSETGTVHFARTDPASSPDRGLGHVAAAPAAGTIAVNAVSLDDYFPDHAAPDFLKCDVEGAEIEVFRGAKRLLRGKRPGIICEMHSDNNKRVLEELFSRLGYACKPCGANHVVALPQ